MPLPVEEEGKVEELSTPEAETPPPALELTPTDQPDEAVAEPSQAAPMPVEEEGKVEEVSTPEAETPPPALELTPADQPDEAVAEPSQAVPLPVKEDGKVEELSTPEAETPPPALELTPADQPDEAVAEPSKAVPLPVEEEGKVEELSTPEAETPPPALELTPADQPDEAVAEPSKAVPLPAEDKKKVADISTAADANKIEKAPVKVPVAEKKKTTAKKSDEKPSAPVRPKKSVAELKAEAEKAKAMPSEAGVESKDGSLEDKQEISDPDLDEDRQALIKAFEEKRIMKGYQPIISFLSEETDSDEEMHSISLSQINRDGTEVAADDFTSQVNTPELHKYVDRWLIREVIGILTNKEKITDTFIIKISDASLADAGFFNWLRKLFTGLDSKNLGKFICMEINASDLATLEKQATALTSFLRKSHDFKFVLGSISNSEEIVTYANKIQFDLIRCNHSIIKELKSISTDAGDADESEEGVAHTQLDLIKSNGTRFIADNIEDATALTESISFGTDYAMGEFIGEPVTQLEDMTNIESFEIV